jgi:hypothetical protein
MKVRLRSPEQVRRDRQRSREWHEKRTAAMRCHCCPTGKVKHHGEFECFTCKLRNGERRQRVGRRSPRPARVTP